MTASVRYLVAGAVTATALAFTSNASDAINVLKLTLLLLCAIGIASLGAVAAVRARAVVLPSGAILPAVASFAVGLVLATAAAPNTATAVLGQYQRNTGLLMYAACIVVVAGMLLAFDAESLDLLVYTVIGIGVVFTAYGLVQLADRDPVGWSNPFNPVLLTLGNPNFAAAYLGILVPISALGALRRDWPRAARAGCAALAIAMFAVAVASEAAQGPLSALAGLAVLSLARLLNAAPNVRRWGIASLGLLTVGGTLLGISAVAGVGPLGGAAQNIGIRARRFYWEAAVEMFRDRPLRGVGLDSYGGFYRAFRPEAATKSLGGANFSDSAHNVPLSMFATGGVVLGVAFLAVLVVVGVALCRGLGRHVGDRRLLLGAFGGGWVAWVVQGLVSIDQVPLTLLGWVLCGATLVAARPVNDPIGRRVRIGSGTAGAEVSPARGSSRLRSGSKPGAKRGKARPVVRRKRRWTTLDKWAAGTIAVVALSAAWFSLVPLRADVASRNGDEAVARGRVDDALAAYGRAVELGPSRGSYWVRRGGLYDRIEQPELALAAYVEGAERDPRTSDLLRLGAKVATSLGRTDEADRLYRRLLVVDPDNPATLSAYASLLTSLREHGRALDLLRAAAELDQSSPELWRQLGDALRTAGEPDGARAAYERALALRPDFVEVSEALAQLSR